MYWEPETQSVYIDADEVIVPNSILHLCQCTSKPELPPIPDTDALTSYLFPTYSEHPNIGAQYFHMNKRRMLHLLHTPELKYFRFNISKQNGRIRRICSPKNKMRQMQQWIKINILYALPLLNCACAYRQGFSIADCAEKHRKKPMVLRLDIVNFFETVTEEQVAMVFYKTCGYAGPVVYLLTKICTFEGKLPQGALTSPMLSNLVFSWYDECIFKFCNARGITYTRYSDDLYFSGDFVPEKIIRFVKNLIAKGDFALNEEKTRVTPYYRRQSVLGLTVNESVSVSREYRRRLRQEMHYIQKYGVRSHILAINAKKYIIDDRVQCKKYLQHLLGQVNYVLSIRKTAEMEKYRDYLLRCLRKESVIGWYSPDDPGLQ